MVPPTVCEVCVIRIAFDSLRLSAWADPGGSGQRMTACCSYPPSYGGVRYRSSGLSGAVPALPRPADPQGTSPPLWARLQSRAIYGRRIRTAPDEVMEKLWNCCGIVV